MLPVKSFFILLCRFDSQSFYNICTERWQSYVYRVFSCSHLITWQQIPISFLPWNKKKTVYVNTSVFDWLYFLWYDAVNSVSFLLSQKSSGLFLSAKVLLTNIATDVYERELNLINKPKTLTAPTVLVSHQIINIWSNSWWWVCAWTCHFALQFQKELKK